MYVGNGLSHEGDCQDDNGGNPKENHCKVKVVNPTDDVWAVGRGHTVASSVGKLCDHSTESG